MATTYEPISTTYMKKRGWGGTVHDRSLYTAEIMQWLCAPTYNQFWLFGCLFVRFPPILSSKHWILENIYENSKYRYIGFWPSLANLIYAFKQPVFARLDNILNSIPSLCSNNAIVNSLLDQSKLPITFTINQPQFHWMEWY